MRARQYTHAVEQMLCALAMLGLLVGCASTGLVDAQTAAQKVTVKLGDTMILLGVRVEDIVSLWRAGKLTKAETNSKLLEIQKWQADIVKAKGLVDAGDLAAGQKSLNAAKRFIGELTAFMKTKGWIGGG